MTAFWVGVASHDHVRAGVEGGFCQLAHGRAAPVARLQTGDRIVYYSPRELTAGGAPVQAFTAIGEVLAEKPHQVDVGAGFKPYRRHVRFFDARVASIRPLLQRLSFTRDKESWGLAFRRSVFRIEVDDYRQIAQAMGVADEKAL
jgi:hypothetical protein